VRCRVQGFDGLRVIDVAAFAGLIAGNTNALSILMGWKDAALVAAGALLQSKCPC
jgi:choline dehydrogenase